MHKVSTQLRQVADRTALLWVGSFRTALEGHLSCVHCHIANIAYRVGHSLEFDPKTERFVGDKEANTQITRSYRKGFEVPKLA